MYRAYNRATHETLECANFKTLYKGALTMLVIGYKYGDVDSLDIEVDDIHKYTLATIEHRLLGYVAYTLTNHKTGKTYEVRQGGIR